MGRVTNASPFLAITIQPGLHLTFKVSQYAAGLSHAPLSTSEQISAFTQGTSFTTQKILYIT